MTITKTNTINMKQRDMSSDIDQRESSNGTTPYSTPNFPLTPS